MNHIWLRCESKRFERRTPLVPAHAAMLAKKGIVVTVEHSPIRCFPDEQYEKVGCEIVKSHSWQNAPSDAYILGLKELSEDVNEVRHTHIYFGHVFKQQTGAVEVLDRFRRGGGTLLDLEYLRDFRGLELVSRGVSFWAGVCGAAVTLELMERKMSNAAEVSLEKTFHSSFEELVEFLERRIEKVRNARILIAGARGVTGSGVRYLLETVGLGHECWGRTETASDSRHELLDFDIFFNCIRSDETTTTLLHPKMLEKPHRLSMIGDVSCDAASPYNPLRIYRESTDFSKPRQTCGSGENSVDIVALDNVASLLPVDASSAISRELFPFLCELFISGGYYIDSAWGTAYLNFAASLARTKKCKPEAKT
ncbi:alanine dehydrogenase/PNT-like protein [Paraburkholderia sp. BL23I1N1]|uniref:saccharopine dehydrogenase n=1 Tax=unclassified Paraburkholderia TaxID=2615204 RepID=UPI000B2E3299|nr:MULTISPECIES: saccharopine dehydrogenase [unclassified Paraburkholderia]REE18552.1 alanine dehydrogenase/PNT-like protein [Paraburkholderia sp. BL27I4N3]RKE35566.1 alanine dehydrogenase/PNT-like protein [Paraburkholderia sp. BL23I1N1]